MKKSHIIAIILVVIYMILVIIFFSNKNNDNQYIIMGNKSVWHFNNNEWNDVSDFNSVTSENEFYVYDGTDFKGKYDLDFTNNRWYIFDQNRNSIHLNQELFASNKNIKVKNFNIDTINVNDINLINKIGKKTYLSSSDLINTNINQKISLDVDKDNKDETIYFISNMFVQDNKNKYFSYVLYVNDNKLYELQNIQENENRLDSFLYSISHIIDYNDDGKYEIIMTRYPFRPEGDCKLMYKLEYGKYKIVKDCD